MPSTVDLSKTVHSLICVDSDDWVTVFRDEEWLEERFLRSKRFSEKQKNEEGT